MLGAIIGDIAGSRFEFHNTKTKDFEIFHRDSDFTDDSICTIGVANAILNNKDFAVSLRDICQRHPNACYGRAFYNWIFDDNALPYNSFGNGSAMRVSPCGFIKDSIDSTNASISSATCSHNHTESIRACMCISETIHDMIYSKRDKNRILYDVFHKYYKDCELDKNLFKKGIFDIRCQYCVPLAYNILADSNSFEDAIRNAIAFGGDSDTMGAIVGSIAEHMFGIPQYMIDTAMSYLYGYQQTIVKEFYKNTINKDISTYGKENY